jgi:hypothetical protein
MFSYTTECAKGPIDYVIGDARLTLGKQPDGKFDVLLIDAFSSDAVPVHLLTTEAIAATCQGEAGRDGDPAPVEPQSRAARPGPGGGQGGRRRQHHRGLRQDVRGARRWRSPAENVVVVAKTGRRSGRLREDPRWETHDTHYARAWTDDYANLAGALWIAARERWAMQIPPWNPRRSGGCLDAGDGLGGDALAAAGEAQGLLGGRRLHADPVERQVQQFGQAGAHRLAVRLHLRGLADQGDVDIDHPAAAGPHPLERMGQEPVRGRALPLRVGGREVVADVAVADRAEQGVGQGVQADVGVGMADQGLAVGDLDAAEPDASPGPKAWTSKPWPMRVIRAPPASRSAISKSSG